MGLARPSRDAGGTDTMQEQRLREELARQCRFAYHRGLVSAAGGNLSARLGTGDTFLISASGVSLREIGPEDFVTVDLGGQPLAARDGQVPSKEVLMHTAVYAARPDVHAVAHLHPPGCIVFAVRGQPIPLVTVTSEERLGPTPVIPVESSGSPALATHVRHALAANGTVNVLLLARHGILSLGASVAQAIDRADLAEYTAKIALDVATWPARPRRIRDVSVPNGPQIPSYPGEDRCAVETIRSIARGDVCNVHRLVMGSHTGTHVDAPRHFLADGPSLDQVPLDRMVGEALVLDLRGRRSIGRAALVEQDIRAGDIVLCRTDNSALWRSREFDESYCHLALDGAELLIERGVKTIGIDYLSIEIFGTTDFPVHKALLGHGILIIEGLDLGDVSPGRYPFACLPLSFAGLDGAPARAVLLD
jgi:arylformamidase